jgi:DNA-binding beta-propeller fold protein YncE
MLTGLLISSLFLAPSGRFLNQIDGFLEPSHAVWMPDGNIAVADRMADEIVIVSPAGERISTTASEGVQAIVLTEDGQVHPLNETEGPKWEMAEVRKQGISSKSEAGWIVPDELGHSIHHFDLEGNFLGKWGVHALLPHEGEGKLHYPNAVTVSPDGTKIIVCEGFEGRIQIFELGEGEPEPAPLITNIAHFGKHIDSYGDLILLAEPELGDVYLFRTGLDVPIPLTRFGGEGKAPHQFKWINGLWIFDGKIKVVGDGNLKTFLYEHDSNSPFKQIPGMVKFQKSKNHESFRGPIEDTITMPSSSDITVTEDGSFLWSVDATSETVTLVTLPDFVVVKTIDGFVEPSGIEIEADGNILVSDIGASNIKRFSPAGELLLTFGEKGFAPHQMYKPAGMTVLDDGTIVVVDWGNHRAQLYGHDGTWQATFGKGRSWTREKNPPPHTVTSNAGNWKVTFLPTPEEMPLNEIFELTTWIEGDQDIKSLRVDAAMPAHGHGMMTDPVTTLQEDGSYKTTGMLLSMPGHWELYFDVDDGRTIERAQDEVTLQP